MSDETKRAAEIQCPICGYYCLGKGGVGCIDKRSAQPIEGDGGGEPTKKCDVCGRVTNVGSSWCSNVSGGCAGRMHPTTPSAQRETDDAEAIVAAIRSKIDMTSASPVDWVWETLAVLEAQGKIESAQSGETPDNNKGQDLLPRLYAAGTALVTSIEKVQDWDGTRVGVDLNDISRVLDEVAALSSNPRPDGVDWNREAALAKDMAASIVETGIIPPTPPSTGVTPSDKGESK